MKTITKTIKYAYVKDIVLLPNIEFKETEKSIADVVEGSPEQISPHEIGKETTHYKSRISISYELKDENGDFADNAHKEHYSEPSDTMLSYEQYTAWRNENEAAFIAADKEELAGYKV